MAIIVNATETAGHQGLARQRLLSGENAPGGQLVVERITLSAGPSLMLKQPPRSLAWLHVLKGRTRFKAYYTDHLEEGHSIFLPPNFTGSLSGEPEATLLYAEIPDAQGLDHEFAARTPLFIVTHWDREPVLACSDGRKRVPLVTQDMCDTLALKVEMVIFPPGTAAPEARQEGAQTALYIVAGHGSATAGEANFVLNAGDVISFENGERHTIKAGSSEELRFIELHTPASFKTVWTDPAKMSVWRSTDHDIHGRETELDEKERKTFRFVFPWTV